MLCFTKAIWAPNQECIDLTFQDALLIEIIMFKTEEQINERLNSSRNLVNRFGKKEIARVPPQNVEITPLKQPGNVEKPKLDPEQKDEIALRARLGERQTSLAKEFGVSQSAIGEIEQGRTKVNEDLVNGRMDAIQDVAMTKLLESLGYLTPEKMDKCKAVEISSIAANMSKVVGNVRGKDVNQGVNVHVQVFAPEIRHEGNFKTIEV